MICYTYVTGTETGPGYVQVIPSDDASGLVTIYAADQEEGGTRVKLELDATHVRALVEILQGAVGDLTEAQELERLLR